ncbi:MAG: OmpA family protein [Rhodothermaceae bacterium]|nr:OmpA family protein [Rhodothermaceae bacterium]
MHTLFKRFRFILPLAILALVGMTTAGCQNMSKTGQGAVVGAGAGAVVGGIIGKATGSTARGAIIGAAVGGTAGAVIGSQMEEQAEELDDELENATVETVPGEDGNTAGIKITFDNAILFDFDSYTLRSNARNDLASLANSLANYPNTDALVVGYTDSVGSDSYNQTLSEQRANAVATFLAQSGVAPTRMQISGMGESNPVASNATDEGRQQNRRVEIALYANEQYRQELENGQGG